MAYSSRLPLKNLKSYTHFIQIYKVVEIKSKLKKQTFKINVAKCKQEKEIKQQQSSKTDQKAKTTKLLA